VGSGNIGGPMLAVYFVVISEDRSLTGLSAQHL
jgi:hypothetical protein